VAEAQAALGGLHGLVNNAGINAYFDAVAMTEEDWDSVFAVDLKAAWMLAKAALPGLIERRGAIVNISSIQARLTLRGFFPYAAAKAGLEGLTRSLALEYASVGVRVNAVAPGYTETQLVQEWLGLQDDPAATLQAVLANIPLGRMATPREIGDVVAFLLSDQASAITGATLAVDCGTGARFAT
jgi:NAD(P)-dependent dehydrogenase (short-subunit alcohol dehydrogenase family)